MTSEIVQVAVLQKPQVAAGEDARQLAVGVGDRHARDVLLVHHLAGAADAWRRAAA